MSGELITKRSADSRHARILWCGQLVDEPTPCLQTLLEHIIRRYTFFSVALFLSNTSLSLWQGAPTPGYHAPISRRIVRAKCPRRAQERRRVGNASEDSSSGVVRLAAAEPFCIARHPLHSPNTRFSQLCASTLLVSSLPRHGAARHGTARHGTAQHATPRHGTARHTWRATRHAPDATRHAPQASGHTPHATRHTPHASRLTPHATRHTPYALCVMRDALCAMRIAHMCYELCAMRYARCAMRDARCAMRDALCAMHYSMLWYAILCNLQ